MLANTMNTRVDSAADVSFHPDFNDHEEVVIRDDGKCCAIIAVHNTNLGPATGGCRIYPYPLFDDALGDVLRLSRGMTFKSAMANIQFGGGKSVIIANPATDKSREMMLAMGDFIESLQGRYIAAEDSGTSVADIKIMAERTRHVAGFVRGEQHGGDPSPMTALGVFLGIEAALRYRNMGSLGGIRVAIQGIGNVGWHLASLLRKAGAEVIAADSNAVRLKKAVKQLGVKTCSIGKILSRNVDVLAPCAMGSAIRQDNVDQIKATIIAGAANNQLEVPSLAEELRQRGVLYAPDYIINAGGIIDIYYQRLNIRDRDRIRSHLEIIPHNLANIFKRSDAEKRNTAEIADELARAVFERSNKSKRR
ncbi:MAG: Glu/Leu/Phe/Val dehydrogenase dimerization domain-containing protein [Gammaproteobacteria bacterium]